MPSDGWAYTVGGKYWDLVKRAEDDHPGYTFVRAEPITTGLWRNVVMQAPDGQLVTRRLFF